MIKNDFVMEARITLQHPLFTYTKKWTLDDLGPINLGSRYITVHIHGDVINDRYLVVHESMNCEKVRKAFQYSALPIAGK